MSDETQPKRTRRRQLMVAMGAGVSGAGLGWWLQRPAPQAQGSDADSLAALWALRLDRPEGGELVLADFRGKPLLLNFWATWCPPCVEELPLLDTFYQEQKAKGWQVLGLAVDQPSAVRKWLQAKPLSFPVGMAGLGGTELSKSLGNLAGSLPFTAVFGGSGALLHRKTGKVSSEDLAQWIKLK